MYQESLQIYNLWRLAVQERDEAREQLKHSLAELSQLRELINAVLWYEEQISSYHTEATDKTSGHLNGNHNPFTGDSPSRFSSVSPSDLVSNQIPSVVENVRDYETVMLERIGGTLPEYGKFLEAVGKAGSLVESLFLTGPVPKWRNPPVQLYCQRPVMSNNITGNWNYGGLESGSGSKTGLSHAKCHSSV